MVAQVYSVNNRQMLKQMEKHFGLSEESKALSQFLLWMGYGVNICDVVAVVNLFLFVYDLLDLLAQVRILSLSPM
mgnify:FL=1